MTATMTATVAMSANILSYKVRGDILNFKPFFSTNSCSLSLLFRSKIGLDSLLSQSIFLLTVPVRGPAPVERL